MTYPRANNADQTNRPMVIQPAPTNTPINNWVESRVHNNLSRLWLEHQNQVEMHRRISMRSRLVIKTL